MGTAGRTTRRGAIAGGRPAVTPGPVGLVDPGMQPGITLRYTPLPTEVTAEGQRLLPAPVDARTRSISPVSAKGVSPTDRARIDRTRGSAPGVGAARGGNRALHRRRTTAGMGEAGQERPGENDGDAH